MSSSQQATQVPLPTLLTEFEQLLILWGEYPDQCDNKRLARLNLDVCTALKNIRPKPKEYSKYLRTVLQIIKNPIRRSQPVPWEQIHSLKSLSSLCASTSKSKVVIRIPGTLPVVEMSTARQGLGAKRKYADTSANMEKVKEEELEDVIYSADATRGRNATPSRPKASSRAGPSRKTNPTADRMEIDPSDQASVLTEQCSYCIAHSYEDCEKTGAQGACSACGAARVRCSLKDQVNDYWKSIGKIGRRSQSRSRSRAPSERKTPQPRQRKKSVPRVSGESEDETESKPAKKPRVTPTSRINALEVVIDDLETRLAAVEAKLDSVLQSNTKVGQQVTLAALCRAEEERAQEREVEKQEQAAQRAEWEARGRELRAMSDVVTQLWDAFRPSIPPVPTWPAPNESLPIQTTIAPPLLRIMNPQDTLGTNSLSPSEILARQSQQTQSCESRSLVEGYVGTEGSATTELNRSPGVGRHVDDFAMADVIHDEIERDQVSIEPRSPPSNDIEMTIVGPDAADESTGPPIKAIVEIVNAVLEGIDINDDNMTGTLAGTVPESTEQHADIAQGGTEVMTSTGDSLPQTDILPVPVPESMRWGMDKPPGDKGDGENLEPAGDNFPVNGSPQSTSEADPTLDRSNAASEIRVRDGTGEGEDAPMGERPGLSHLQQDGEVIDMGPATLPVPEDIEDRSPSSSDNTGGEKVVLDDTPGPSERRLRQRTPGLDYRLIGNPQARGSRGKSANPTNIPSSGGVDNRPLLSNEAAILLNPSLP